MSNFHYSKLSEHINVDIDMFFCSSSFEDRCFLLPNAFPKDKIKNAFVCFNRDQEGSILENAQKLTKVLPNASLVKFHSNNPIQILEGILEAFTKIPPAQVKSVFIDITTFTHEGLLILYKVISVNCLNAKIILGYSEAGEYSFNVSEPSEKWLSKGVGEVRTVMGYPGYMSPIRKNHLIILFGFEVERTQKIIDTFEPDLVSVGISAVGLSINDEHYKINLDRHKTLIDLYPFIESFEISLLHPIQTSRQLLDQIAKYPGYNVIVAPMNNKISTLGAAIASETNKEIQICYVKANIYNKDGYSTTGEKIFLMEIR